MKKLIHKIKCKISDLQFRYYYWQNVKRGFISNNGTPLKCHECDSIDLKDYNKLYEEHILIEYDCKCNKCGTMLGHWAYGYWET